MDSEETKDNSVYYQLQRAKEILIEKDKMIANLNHKLAINSKFYKNGGLLKNIPIIRAKDSLQNFVKFVSK